jgi:hypothetical protein
MLCLIGLRCAGADRSDQRHGRENRQRGRLLAVLAALADVSCTALAVFFLQDPWVLRTFKVKGNGEGED